MPSLYSEMLGCPVRLWHTLKAAGALQNQFQPLLSGALPQSTLPSPNLALALPL